MDIQAAIAHGKTVLGVELGSTRIKAVLLSEDHTPIASGSYAWENRYENGVWTYHLEDVWAGLQESYRSLSSEVFERHGLRIQSIGAIGFSAMMHGYLAFGQDGTLLAPFRTWRNTITGLAAAQLTELFQFNIPQRWSIAHLYQAILNQEPHVGAIGHLTTLAGYVHWKLTGQQVLGVGEASGMFPIDSALNDYDARMVERFSALPEVEPLPWMLRDILPRVLVAGEPAGALSEAGARLLDPSGYLRAGIPLCPPEGDAGTGMVATNSVAARTGNISAGTSVFAMIVLEQELSQLYPEIDMVMTPTGKPVAMVHSNNCTSDLNAWVDLFQEFSRVLGVDVAEPRLYELLYQQALAADADGGGLLAYNYVSGEHITHLEQGRPLFVRTPESRFTLANFMRVHLFAALGALKIGLDLLVERERVQVDQILGHGGFFKTKDVGQRIMAAALQAPVSVMETAGEGGAWGIALLASYMLQKAPDEPLEAYLADKVFAGQKSATVAPDAQDVAGFAAFMGRYRRGLIIERAAVEALS
ncbi:FGGY-family carbohydrate kinase [Oscillochloris sp. ZM17-4]|uniref:xylulokinase n=1 Tax=Oscillochloris sp. ZM17-4 TaxID=2866714 RepID=UPI001C72D0A5|nr:FGGY-family carbohydrate kinase [Oscillochloris sp. ZM17-4]MBX0331243.1 FGGY-family carbohydrate kinase [Oscillochloris sp. ZM17-4]